jgi:hypothetical protein
MVQDRFHDIWRVFDLGEPETVFRQIFRALDDEIEA